MLILLNNGWPWILIGILVTVLGIKTLAFSKAQWIHLLLNLPFLLFPEPTRSEKEEAKHQAPQEVATANPGCLFFLAGIIMVIYGCFRIIG